MILFDEDRAKYPYAIYDWDTANRSFVDLAGIFKLMNVKNHAFMLALHNPMLRGIDPHDPKLSRKQQRMVMKESFDNPWYFFREVVKAPPKAGVNPMPFQANRGNIATIWLFFNHIMMLLIQPRQTGKSFTADSLMSGLLNVWCTNTKINLLTKDDSLRGETIERIKEIIAYLPPYMNLRTKKDNNNSESISIGLANNTYLSHVAQSSEKAAFKAARGLSTPIIHIDEFAYFKHIATTLPSALPSLGAAMEDARRNNAPHGVILTTTAGWLDSDEGKYAHDFYQSATVWSETFYDVANLKQLKKILRLNGDNDDIAVVLDMNHRQLGKTDAWLKERILESRSTGGKAETDFLNIWASGSSSSPIDKHVLAAMKENLREDHTADISNQGYIVRWYGRPESNIETEMIMGLDTSDAVGSDDIAMSIRKVKDGSVIAVAQFNETNTITFAEWVVDMLIKYPNMTLMIERRSTGTSILDYVMKILSNMGFNPYTRIFNWIVQEKNSNPDRYALMEKYGHTEEFQDKHRKEVGFATAANGRASRNKLYGEGLMQSMQFMHKTVYDKKLGAQISKLMIKNDRIDHSSGEKDDLVISWLLGYWFLNNAKHVEAYGYNQDTILSEVSNAIGTNVEDNVEAKVIMEMKFRINELITILSKTTDKTMANVLTNRIHKLKAKLPESERELTLNINKVINDILSKPKETGYKKDDFHIPNIRGVNW